MQCKLLMEIAYGPMSSCAEEILEKNNVLIIPDVLCSAGTIIVGYFEFVKNLGHISPAKLTKRWETKSNAKMYDVIYQVLKEKGSQMKADIALEGAGERDLVISGLEEILCNAISETKATAEIKGVNLRTAAYINALKRINENQLNGSVGV
jgi:glutamate dehydrogenase/leucine dehydrogenase